MRGIAGVSLVKAGIFAVLCAALPVSCAAADSVTVTLTDDVAGGTVRHLGGYNATRAVRNEDSRKHLEGTEINCTKLWLPIARGGRKEYWDRLSKRPGKFYEDGYKDFAVRQVTQSPESIDWNAEINCDPNKLTKRETELKMLKDNGIEPVLNIDKRLYKDERMRRAYWRYTFLLNYYVNKVKDYKFTLWEFGCEDSGGGPEQLEVGSDAIRESVKLTGFPVIVAGCGDDAKFEDNFDTVLKSGYAGRVRFLTFHSFQFAEEFPALGHPGWKPDGPTLALPMKLVLQRFDNLQKKIRPDAAPLPYWDTGWAWKKTTGSEMKGGRNQDFPSNSDPLTSMAYIGRIIQQCENRVSMNLYCRLMEESESKTGGGAMERLKGKLDVTPLFYAMRMMARANAGDKERLKIGAKPDDAVMQSLATRSASQLFITCLSRRQDATLRVTLKGLAPYKGRGYVVRRHDGKKMQDEVQEKGVLDGDLTVELPPLTAFQAVIERK